MKRLNFLVMSLLLVAFIGCGQDEAIVDSTATAPSQLEDTYSAMVAQCVGVKTIEMKFNHCTTRKEAIKMMKEKCEANDMEFDIITPIKVKRCNPITSSSAKYITYQGVIGRCLVKDVEEFEMHPLLCMTKSQMKARAEEYCKRFSESIGEKYILSESSVKVKGCADSDS